MPGFCEIAVVYILVAVYFTYLSQWLQIRWRRWLTVRFLDEWLADRAYYRISLTTDRAAIGTDNPDQRIAEDIRDFVDNTLTLASAAGEHRHTGKLSRHPVVAVRHHHAVRRSDPRLHGLGRAGLRNRRHLAHPSGRPAAGLLRFRQQRVEADFRYSLVRVRENTEGIALYSGEAEEKGFFATASST